MSELNQPPGGNEDWPGSEPGSDRDGEILPHDPDPTLARIIGPLPGTVEWQEKYGTPADPQRETEADVNEAPMTAEQADPQLGEIDFEEAHIRDIVKRGRQTQPVSRWRRIFPEYTKEQLWRPVRRDEEPPQPLRRPVRTTERTPKPVNERRSDQVTAVATAAGVLLGSYLILSSKQHFEATPTQATTPISTAPYQPPASRNSVKKPETTTHHTGSAHHHRHYTIADYSQLAALLSDNGFQIVHSLDGGKPERNWTAYTGEIESHADKATWLLVHGLRMVHGVWDYQVYIWNDTAPENEQPGASKRIGPADATAPKIHRLLERTHQGA